MELGLAGKRALVTGASGGLGAGMAEELGRHGARVVVHYRSRPEGAEQTAAAVRAGGGEAVTVYGDLRAESALERALREAWAVWDGLDVVINNAGVVLKAAALDAGSEHWDDTLNINLRAPYLLARRAAGAMIAAGIPGVILHNTSIHGHRSVPHFSAYAASKAGLEALMQVQALEWAEHGIRVNAVAPGVVPVERTAEALEANRAGFMPHIPLGRYGAVADIARLTAYLASDAAGWVTGQSFVADGGTLARLDLPRRPKPPAPGAPEPVDPS
ncbi:SDR family NAD(P)-dependent oxidoreductase [Thiohalorhabdus methylotrophus]|uniref:SDR family NAD(P)-dependent oxidoreductase n=1 Tax=Thiohalorhabdus methylotrophus TaxID=3242694 RepID=A0ABV4TTW8_9GAMM